MKPRTGLTLAAIGVVLIFIALAGKTTQVVSTKEHTYIGNLTWLNSYDAGLKKASQEDKPVVLYFWATWCKYCAKLNEEVLPSEEVNSKLRENFVLVAINIDEDKKTTSKYGVQYPPAIIFVNSKGEVITKLMGYTPEENFLRYVNRAMKGA